MNETIEENFTLLYYEMSWAYEISVRDSWENRGFSSAGKEYIPYKKMVNKWAWAGERMENDYFTVTEMENETKIPHQTIRRYMKIHGHYLVMKKSHRSFLIHEKSIKTLNIIRSLYSEGKTSKQVDDHLINNGFALNLDTENNHEDMSNVVPGTLQELKDDLNILHEKLNNQEKFNRLLLEKIVEQNEKIDSQQKEIDERLMKRDELLLKSMREILEVKSLNISVKQIGEGDHQEENQEEKEKKKWYHLFFKKNFNRDL